VGETVTVGETEREKPKLLEGERVDVGERVTVLLDVMLRVTLIVGVIDLEAEKEELGVVVKVIEEVGLEVIE